MGAQANEVFLFPLLLCLRRLSCDSLTEEGLFGGWMLHRVWQGTCDDYIHFITVVPGKSLIDELTQGIASSKSECLHCFRVA
jgi:hypothetical protein